MTQKFYFASNTVHLFNDFESSSGSAIFFLYRKNSHIDGHLSEKKTSNGKLHWNSSYYFFFLWNQLFGSKDCYLKLLSSTLCACQAKQTLHFPFTWIFNTFSGWLFLFDVDSFMKNATLFLPFFILAFTSLAWWSAKFSYIPGNF